MFRRADCAARANIMTVQYHLLVFSFILHLLSASPDCSLNGVFVASNASCVCDSPWRGQTCGELAPSNARGSAAAGGDTGAPSTWGASVLRGDDGRWHAYLAAIADGCGMRDWATHSTCVHAIGAGPAGPFDLATAQTVLPAVCHNPAVVAADGGFYLFFIGRGNASTPLPACGSLPPGGDVGSGLLFAPTFDGPWHWVDPQPPYCNNPGPLRLRSGSWLLACKSAVSIIYTAPSAKGPWTQLANLPPNTNASGRYEDSFLWEDARGNIHALFHAYKYAPAPQPPGTCAGDLVAAHEYSADGGRTWTRASVAPYGNTYLDARSGALAVVSTRERPKLAFADAARTRPLALLNGVSALQTCPPPLAGTCVDCKWNGSTFTLGMLLD